MRRYENLNLDRNDFLTVSRGQNNELYRIYDKNYDYFMEDEYRQQNLAKKAQNCIALRKN